MSRICLLIATFVGVSVPYSLVGAQAVGTGAAVPAAKANFEVVLLDNGRVLQGQVTRTVDQVHVQTLEGSRIVLSAKRVDAICDSLGGAWQRRASKIKVDDVQGHLSLFHWCLKHHLKDEAQQQLNRLQQTDMEARRLKSLERQLVRKFEAPKMVTNKKAEESDSLSFLDIDQVFHPLPAVESKRDSLPAVTFDRAIALASHTESIPAAKKVLRKKDFIRTPNKKSIQNELDSIMDSLARDDRNQFQRRIQPILLKGCLAAKCHNSEANVMPLMHRGRGQLVPKRFTQRNLQAILKWIDLNHLDSSELLKQSTVSHGGQKSPALEIGSKEFELLSAWLQSVAENSPELIPASAPSGSEALVKQVGYEANEGKAHRVPRIDAALRKRTSPAADQRTSPAAGRHASDRLTKLGADPFDPATFNQLPR